MSNYQAAAKVAEQLISKVFNHCQFTNGEANYLVSELSEKTDVEANLNKILKINENACVISDLSSDNLCKSSDITLAKIKNQVDGLQERIEKVFKIDEESRLEDEELREIRESNRKVAENVREELDRKLRKVQETLAREESIMEGRFLKFEQGLRDKPSV